MPLPKKTGNADISNISMENTNSAFVQASEVSKAKKKLEREQAQMKKLPPNYVGGVDPLGILGLFLSGIPIVGLIICIMSLINYKKNIYDDGKYLPIVGIIMQILMVVVVIGGMFLLTWMTNMAGMHAAEIANSLGNSGSIMNQMNSGSTGLSYAG